MIDRLNRQPELDCLNKEVKGNTDVQAIQLGDTAIGNKSKNTKT